MVVMEDEGIGCVHRLFLIFNHMVTKYHLFRWVVRVDGKVAINITLDRLLKGQTAPFLDPLSGVRSAGPQGLYTSVPVCYRKSIQMSFHHPTLYDGKAFKRSTMYTCIEAPSYCHHMPMWNVDWHRYAPSIATNLSGYHDTYSHPSGRKHYDAVRQYIAQPAERPPTQALRATATAAAGLLAEGYQQISFGGKDPTRSNEEGEDEEVVLLQRSGAGVVTAVMLSLEQQLQPAASSGDNPFPAGAWLDVAISVAFDGSTPPQIDNILLGEFFGASLREWMHRAEGLHLGVRQMTFVDDRGATHRDAWVGYCYFPMPFWRNVRITLRYHRPVRWQGGGKVVVYHRAVVSDTPLPSATNAYFHAKWHRQRPTAANQPHTFLNLTGGWGHVVGINVLIEGLRDVIQGDPQFWWDRSDGALFLGTGTEDYFNYAHGWEFQEPRNQSQPLSGVPAKGVGGFFVWNRKLRRYDHKLHGDNAMINGVHAYRRLLVDCLPFNDGFRGHFEIGSNWTQNNYRQAAEFATLALYYHRPLSKGLRLLADIGPRLAGDGHGGFEATPSEPVTVTSRLVGPVDSPLLVLEGLASHNGSSIRFSIPAPVCPAYGLILRRVADYSVANQRAQVFINDQSAGVWRLLGVNPHFRLVESDLLVDPAVAPCGSSLLRFEIKPETNWVDLRFRVFAVV
eukprot:TRINITY_DN7852_c0_g2_i2.p1 TRINITY_DN7852_c0_g2~~TRINITY_DN7852_c0_g2_i2.p1  ORF type:complete len:678 (+),score=116.13 TRINITY_DN7852_c0_g2_i2:562-2595(+)